MSLRGQFDEDASFTEIEAGPCIRAPAVKL